LQLLVWVPKEKSYEKKVSIVMVNSDGQPMKHQQTEQPHFASNHHTYKNKKTRKDFEISDLFSSLLIFTIIKAFLSTFFYCY
jgi:hypothetical protein